MDTPLAQTFAERYQSVLVPVIFEPWARELIQRASPKAGEHIIDLACGTGVVMRELVKLGMKPGRLVGVDHSSDMLEVAKHLNALAGIDVEVAEADAGNLPFSDNQFDLAFCQQALQFFSDQTTALRELRRVLRPGGRALFCVQRDIAINPMLEAQARALETHVSAEAGAAVRAICGLPDAAELRRLFEDAGFRNVEIESVTLTLYHADAKAFALGAMGGMHTGDKLKGLDDKRVADAVADFLAGLGDYYENGAMRVPHISNVVKAEA